MTLPLEIPPKRKIFYELLVKMLKLQQKEEIEIEFEDLKSLKLELSDLKKNFPNYNNQILLNFLDFLEKSNILKKIKNQKVLKEEINNLKIIKFESKLEKESYRRLSDLFETEIKKFRKESVEFKIDKTSVSQIFDEILKISNLLISKIKPKYEEFIQKQKLKEQELNDILTQFSEIKKITNFEEFFDKYKTFSRSIRDKGLIYSVSQINKSKNEYKIDKDHLKTILLNIILPKLEQAIILFIINTFGPQTVNNLNQKTGIPKNRIFKSILSILDRKEIEFIGEKENQPIYSKIKLKLGSLESINNILKKLLNFKSKISWDSESFLTIIQNMNELIKYLENIEDFDEKIIQEDILKLNNNLQKLNALIPENIIDKNQENLIDRIDAMIEALNLYRLNLVFEKKDNLKEISSEIDEKVSKLILGSIDQDFERGQIINSIKKIGPQNIIEIYKNTGLSKDIIYSHMIQLKNENKIRIIGEKEGYDLYDVPRVRTEEELLLDSIVNDFKDLIKIEKEFEKNYSNIKYNLDKISKNLDELPKILNKILKITYLDNQFDKVIFEKFLTKIREVQQSFANIKGKIMIKKAEIKFDELVPILIPSTEDKYSHLIEPKQLIGFGTIKSNEKKCLSCRSCQDICEESAVTLRNIWNLPLIFELTEEELNDLPETKTMLIKVIKRIANKKPTKIINLPEGAIGYGRPEFEPAKCIACKKCVERCPNEAIEFEEVWNFPEIIRSVSKSLIMED